jgi:hypothetical protein
MAWQGLADNVAEQRPLGAEGPARIDRRDLVPAPSKHWPSTRALLIAMLVIATGLFLMSLFCIGLTLHETYESKLAMGEHVAAPPLNGFYEWVHGLISGEPDHPVGGWLWLPQGWLWR